MTVLLGDAQPSWRCDVCGDWFEDEEPHEPHEPGCHRAISCQCDIWTCEPCCWECQ